MSTHFPVSQLRAAIQEAYSEVALQPSCTFHFLSGRPLAERLGYGDELLLGIPEGAIDSFAGVGNPFATAALPAGAKVLDVGSGAGMDALIAARMVGPTGSVVGVDLTDAMVLRARQNAALVGATNTSFVEGVAEELPLPDGSVDVVISNGVINLCPDKPAVFRELYRVLRPGGRLQIADVLLEIPVSPHAKDLVHLWTDCVAGGVPVRDYLSMLNEAGFYTAKAVRSYDTFAGAEVEQRAHRYGARGHDVLAVKPTTIAAS